MQVDYSVRLLNTSDVELYRSIRLKALSTDPASFGGLYEEEVLYEDAKFEDFLKQTSTFAIFNYDKIIGSVSLEIPSLTKIKHDGGVLGLYIAPEHRSKNAGGALLSHLIEYAKGKVVQLSLYCISESLNAIKFYEKHGFVTTGIYPRSLKMGDKFYDSNMMFLKLD